MATRRPRGRRTAIDRIVFQASWEPARIPATLDHLVYDGELIDGGEAGYGPGRLALAFERPAFPVRRFQWSILFVGKKLKSLEATASVNGVESALSSTRAAENRWADEGDWEAPES